MIAENSPRALTAPVVTANGLDEVANDLWVLRFPLALLGTQMGRTVTVMRLSSGHLIVHSTAPFTPADITAIHALGRPAWLVDATLFHDTFARHGQAAFPDIPYFTPSGFRRPAGRASAISPETPSLTSPPTAWAGEVDVLQLHGMPKVREHVFLHRATRTLVVADLLFNFGPRSSAWTRWFFRWPGGIRQFPGMSRLFRASIRDRAAFARSIESVMQWDFDRLIVGHGEIIECGAKAKLKAALAAQGF